MKLPSFREWHKGEGERTSDAAGATYDTKAAAVAAVTPEEQIETAYQAVLSVLRTDLLERIAQNTPKFFEQLIVDLLVGMGYGGSHKNAASQLGQSGDGGVDGVINEDRLGLDRVYIQAKRYGKSNAVGRPEIQAFVGSLVGLGATKGVFVTTSTFSPQARDFVKHLSQRVILIDGQSLADLMIEHEVGVRTSRAIKFKRLDETSSQRTTERQTCAPSRRGPDVRESAGGFRAATARAETLPADAERRWRHLSPCAHNDVHP
jgi:restriction system protein